MAFAAFFRRFHLRDSAKVVILLSISFLLVALESAVKGLLPFSGLIAVMACGWPPSTPSSGWRPRCSSSYWWAPLWT